MNDIRISQSIINSVINNRRINNSEMIFGQILQNSLNNSLTSVANFNSPYVNNKRGNGFSNMLLGMNRPQCTPYNCPNQYNFKNGIKIPGNVAIDRYNNYLNVENMKNGRLNLPSNAAMPASFSVTSSKQNRSASLYNAVIKQFDVENSARYARRNGNTYCNIFVWDATRAMGVEIPHYTDKNGYIVDSKTKGAVFMNANKMKDWLDGRGKEYGWREVSAREAQMYANKGYPSVASWKNPSGHGHIQMVVPSKDGMYNEQKGVAIAQAGSKNIEYGYINDVYKKSALKQVSYYVNI